MNDTATPLQEKILPFFKGAVLWLAYINLLLPMFNISNVTPLIALGVLGLFTYFMPQKNKVSRYALLCFVYFAYVILMDYFVFTEHHGVAIYRSMLAAFFSGSAIYYVTRQKDFHYTNFAVSAFIFTAIVALFMCFFIPDSKPFFSHDQRLILFRSHPNYLGLMLGIALVSGASSLVFPQKKFSGVIEKSQNKFFNFSIKAFDALTHKITMAIGTLLLGVALVFTHSRTAWFGVIFAVFAMLFFKIANHTGYTKAFCIVLLTSIAFFAALHAIPESYANKSFFVQKTVNALKNPMEEATFKSRIPIWASAATSGMESPLIGHGPKSFAKNTHPEFVRNNYEDLVKKFGKGIIDNDTSCAAHAHNQFLQIFTEQGLIGLILFTFILIVPLITSVIKKNTFGITAPLITFFIVFSSTETVLQYFSGISFPATALFSCIGYFSCTKRY